MQLWDSVALERLQKLLTKEGNIVDTARNMIALTPTLHHWWRRAYWGFEPVEQLKDGVRIRIR